MSAQKQFSRRVQVMGPSTHGVSLPAEFIEANGLEKGDDVTIKDVDWDDGTITFSV